MPTISNASIKKKIQGASDRAGMSEDELIAFIQSTTASAPYFLDFLRRALPDGSSAPSFKASEKHDTPNLFKICGRGKSISRHIAFRVRPRTPSVIVSSNAETEAQRTGSSLDCRKTTVGFVRPRISTIHHVLDKATSSQ